MRPRVERGESGRRDGLIVAALVALQIVALTAQVRDGGGTNLLHRLTLAALGPLELGIERIFDAGGAVRDGLRTRDALARENQSLRAELETLRRERAAERDSAQRLAFLLADLGFELPRTTTPGLADVVYADYRGWLSTLVIHSPPPGGGGEAPSLEVGAAVTTHEGLVGRVVTTAGRYGRVQLITDRASSVGAMLERTRRQGILQGQGTGLGLSYVPLQADVRVGDRVVTSGTDGVYPRGLPLGTVAEVETGDELFHLVRVAPAVDFARLQQVYVLAPRQIPEALALGEDS